MNAQDLLDAVRRWDEAASVLPATPPKTITFDDYQIHELLGRLRCRVMHAAQQHPEGAAALDALFGLDSNRRWVLMFQEVKRTPWFIRHVLFTLWDVQ